jgi:glycosyltransferase 2 family protein
LLTQEVNAHSQKGARWPLLGLSLALTVLTLFFVFRGVDKQALQKFLAQQHEPMLLAAAFLLLIQIGSAGERWRAVLSALLRGRAPPTLAVQAVFYSSIFFNCLPVGTVGGDVARIWLARRFHLSFKQLLMSILIDRMLTILALILLAVLTLPRIAHPLAFVAWLGGVAVLAAGIFCFLLLGLVERWLEPWRRRGMVHLVLRAAEELRRLKNGWGLAGFFCAVLSGLASAMAGYCIARSLDIEVEPIVMIAIMSITTLAAALPISMAGWGVREVTLVALLGLVGVDRAATLLLSVEFGLLSTLLSLPGGVIWLLLRERPSGMR